MLSLVRARVARACVCVCISANICYEKYAFRFAHPIKNACYLLRYRMKYYPAGCQATKIGKVEGGWGARSERRQKEGKVSGWYTKHIRLDKKTKTFTKKRKQQNRLEKQANEIRGGRTEVSSTRSAASNYIYKYRDVHTQTGTQADRQTHVALSFVRLA